MNGTDLLRALGHIDETIIEKNAQPPQRRKFSLRKWQFAAACIALSACIGITFLLTQPQLPAPEPWQSQHIIHTDSVPSVPQVGILGSPDADSSKVPAPPTFRFDFFQLIVTAKLISVLPDTYMQLQPVAASNPQPYRVLHLEVLGVISGVGIPQTIYYLMPQSLVVDLEQYDIFLLSMSDFGCENIVLLNTTQQRVESFELLFYSGSDYPELGNFIAFTDGKFDERLWQTKSWHYGYQFGKYLLDKQSDELVVQRGKSLRYSTRKIQEKISQTYQNCTPPRVQRYNFQSVAAQEVLEYVKPFENGVFVSKRTGSQITFYRYINGCPTNEYIRIDLQTEEITYSEYRFNQEDLKQLANLADILQQVQSPAVATPPHLDTAGKTLLTYGACGWYHKTDTGVYGIVKTVWTYKDGADWYTHYYDDEYRLYQIDAEGQIISRDDLLALIGTNPNIYLGEYGLPIHVPYY